LAPASCPGRLFLNSLGRAREDDRIGDQSVCELPPTEVRRYLVSFDWG
jgi:hypothetical protein